MSAPNCCKKAKAACRYGSIKPHISCILSQIVPITPFITSIAPPINSFTFSNISFTASLNHSHLLYSVINIAINAAIAAITNIMGFAASTAFTVVIAVCSVLITFIIVDITPATLLIISSAGAIAATIITIVAIISF